MQYFFHILNWSFFLFFILIGILSGITYIYLSLPMFAVAILFLPPVKNFLYSVTKRKISIGLRTLIVFLLFAAFGLIQMQHEKRAQHIAKLEEIAKQKTLQEQNRKLKIASFIRNRETIVASAKKLFKSEKYSELIEEYTKYLLAEDKELSSLVANARIKITEQKKRENADKILEKLKSIPGNEYAKNEDLYHQLVQMYPSSTQYKKKFTYYKNKRKGAEKRLKEQQVRASKIENQFSGWDGSHRNLTRAIKNSMNDPKSYDHIKTVYWDKDDHLLIRSTFRGKNSFGGLVKNTVVAKVDLNGNILQVLDQY